MEELVKKAHKKKSKKKSVPSKKDKNHNPRAFGVANVVKTKKTQQRNLDRAQKKEIIPLVNREEELPPPVVVVVMGPKGVGKSTLIRSLVKMYTGQNITDTVGPISVIAGKKRRVTFFECPLDIMSMTDLSKISDLVLLMIDASYGFEMETFEFLNQLQLHGFPKVMGVLTNLDKFRANKSLQTTKKALKHRFWTEIYKGAKVFEFMGGVINGKYRKHEVKRLSLYVSRVKFRPLVWRNTHPYVLCDRVEDVTPSSRVNAEGTQCNRDVTVYGYVRGSHLKPSMRMHLIGVGDFDIEEMTSLADPCPLPSSQVLSNGQLTHKSLKSKKDQLLYAPLANVGRVSMDRDGLYIDIKHINYTKRDHLHLAANEHSAGLGEYAGDGTTPMEILRSMQDVKIGVDQQLKKSGQLSLFSNRVSEVTDEDDEEQDPEDEEDMQGGDDDEFEGEDEEGEGENFEDMYYDDDDDKDQGMEKGEVDGESDGEAEEEDEQDGEDAADDDSERNDYYGARKTSQPASHGRGLQQQGQQQLQYTDIMKQVYGDQWAAGKAVPRDAKPFKVDADDDDELFVVKAGKGSDLEKAKQLYQQQNAVDSTRYSAFLQYEERQQARRSAFSQFDEEDEDEGEVARQRQYREKEWLKAVKRRFVTGGYGRKIEAGVTSAEDSSDAADGVNEDDGDGGFEDLQTGEKFGAGLDSDEEDSGDEEDGGFEYDSDEGGEGDEEEEEDSEDAREAHNDDIDAELRAIHAQKKAAFKESFNKQYDDRKMGIGEEEDGEEEGGKKKKRGSTEEQEEQAFLEAAARKQEELRERNRKEFGEDGELARQQHEGFRQGLYVRILLKNVPMEFTRYFRPSLPVLCGGLLPHELTFGFITARVKRHRWHKRILKSNDPLIFSIGWRRYQSIPVYTTEDQNGRERYLKYTPEHMHCTATFYGPLVPPNTGILAYQRTANNTPDFRISLTGVALEQKATPTCVKKLKLVGTPAKVYKNTAFISGMFNSALEVAKFEHAKIKTVSGIRGSIKKAVRETGSAFPPGTFRATFEDKILMSDIVICRLWVPVEIKQFYNPLLSLLAPMEASQEENGDDGTNPEGKKLALRQHPLATGMMRTTSEVRKAELVPMVVKKDSVYKPIVREERVFSKLVIPAKLQATLPYASKPKQQKPKNRESYLARRAVLLEPEERKARAAIQTISTIRAEKVEKRQKSQSLRNEKRREMRAKETERFSDVYREEKKRKYTEQGKEAARREKKARNM